MLLLFKVKIIKEERKILNLTYHHFDILHHYLNLQFRVQKVPISWSKIIQLINYHIEDRKYLFGHTEDRKYEHAHTEDRKHLPAHTEDRKYVLDHTELQEICT